jgi:hypothetical protein
VADFLATQFITLHAPPAAPTGRAALDRLHQEFADAYFYRTEHPELAAVLFELQLRGRRDPAIRKIIEPLLGHWQYGIERWLTEGVEEGVFRPDLAPARAAAFLVAALAGASAFAVATSQLEQIFAEVELWLLAPGAHAALKSAAKCNAAGPSDRAAGGKKTRR